MMKRYRTPIKYAMPALGLLLAAHSAFASPLDAVETNVVISGNIAQSDSSSTHITKKFSPKEIVYDDLLSDVRRLFSGGNAGSASDVSPTLELIATINEDGTVPSLSVIVSEPDKYGMVNKFTEIQYRSTSQGKLDDRVSRAVQIELTESPYNLPGMDIPKYKNSTQLDLSDPQMRERVNAFGNKIILKIHAYIKGTKK